MDARSRCIGAALGLAAGLQAATQFAAATLPPGSDMAPALALSPSIKLYPSWAVLSWRTELAKRRPRAFRLAGLLVLLGVVGGLAAGAAFDQATPVRRSRGWGDLRDARAAGLMATGGCILGELQGQLLATEDLRPTLVTGGTRSGKGRGHVIPTLLSWRASVLIYDPKGELWRATSGFRSSFSHAFCFNPRLAASARWNPLAEIHPGPGELADVQRLVAILADPAGARNDDAIWDTAASEILEAVILHVLYTAPAAEKTLLTVRDQLADLDRAAELMSRTLHRLGPDGAPQTHPFIRTAVRGYAAMHDRFRTSVQGTARSYLKWLAGEDLERSLSASDFALGDLMCARAPASLYVQVAPADAAALRPLVRLIFQAATQALTAHEDRDAQGRPKRHKLLLVMDEFPLLGRIAFFEKSLRLMSGYGLKAMLVAQSLNDIAETYGGKNTILDNCHVYTAFAALDPLTQDKVSRLTGTVAEERMSRSGPAGFAGGRASVSRSQTDRPLLEPGEVRSLPGGTQLVFVTGARALRTLKVQYDRREPFRTRAAMAPVDQALGLDTPGAPIHPWSGRQGLGETAEPPLFSEADRGREDRRAPARSAATWPLYGEGSAPHDQTIHPLQGRTHAKDQGADRQGPGLPV